MKKSILMISLMTVAMAVFAINYPTYKPTTPTYGGGGSTSNGNSGTTGTTYGGYSTTTSGGVTTYGEGAATGPARGPRRTNWGDGTPVAPQSGDTRIVWDSDLGRYVVEVFDGTDWHSEEGLNPADYGASSQSPIGSTMVLLFFAAAAAGVIALRRRKAMVIVALLLMANGAWAYNIKGGTYTLVFDEGAVAKINTLSQGQVAEGHIFHNISVTMTNSSGITATFNSSNRVFNFSSASSNCFVTFDVTGGSTGDASFMEFYGAIGNSGWLQYSSSNNWNTAGYYTIKLSYKNSSWSYELLGNATKHNLTLSGDNGSFTVDGSAYNSANKQYTAGSHIVVAIPDEGYEFVEWSDGVNTATHPVINLTEDKTLTATFRLRDTPAPTPQDGDSKVGDCDGCYLVTE